MPTTRLTAVVAVAFLAAPVSPAAEPWELLKLVPAGTNGVLTINVQRMMASPRAQADGWAKLDHTELLAGAVPVGPNIERLVVAKALDPAALAAGGSVALIPTRAAVDLAQLAGKLGASPDTIDDQPVLRTSAGGFYLPMDGNLLAAVWGGSRQQVAGWARAARAAEKSPLRREFSDVVANLAGRSHICLVVDLHDLLDRPAVQAAVANTQAVRGDADLAKQLETYLAGLSTGVLTAEVATRGLETRLTLNSRALPGKLSPEVMKAFLVELLDRNGARLEDLPSAVAKSSQRSFSFEFRLSDPELAAITHLFVPPLPAATDAAGIAVAPAGPTAEATGKYLKLVDRQVDGLRRKLPAAGDDSVATLWYDSAANAIVVTSVLGVDPQAVEYGMSTAGRLRAIADSYRGQPIRLAELNHGAYLYALSSGGRGLLGWNPTVQVNTNLPQVRAQQAEVIRKDAANRAQVWKDIETKRADLRAVMASKYKLAN